MKAVCIGRGGEVAVVLDFMSTITAFFSFLNSMWCHSIFITHRHTYMVTVCVSFFFDHICLLDLSTAPPPFNPWIALYGDVTQSVYLRINAWMVPVLHYCIAAAVLPRHTVNFIHKKQRVQRNEQYRGVVTVPVETSSNFPSDAKITCRVSPSAGIHVYFRLRDGCTLLLMDACDGCTLTVTLSTNDTRIEIGEQSTTKLSIIWSSEWKMPYYLIFVHSCMYSIIYMS